jgi:signal transduction histidine kinase
MENTAHILVVDDEAGIQRGCRRALEAEGFKVETASSFQEGLRQIQEGAFDLVLLDVMLPGGRGVDLLPSMQARDPDLVCVIITGYATVELAVEAIKRGAYDFISKPFTSEMLLLTVNQGLEKRRLSLEAKRLQAVEKEVAELAQANAEMERLEKFRTTFMLTIAHELRSPVSSAQSLLHPLMRGLAGELKGTQLTILERIEIRLNELSELIEDLLALTAAKTLAAEQPLRPVVVQPVVRRVVERLTALAEGKGIALVFQAPEQDQAVRATEDGLDRVLNNLIGNAIKYTPAGGRVECRVTSCPIARGATLAPPTALPAPGPQVRRIAVGQFGCGPEAEGARSAGVGANRDVWQAPPADPGDPPLPDPVPGSGTGAGQAGQPPTARPPDHPTTPPSVTLSVADTGLGIPQEALPHIWDEFYRAPNARQAGITGTGLGLSIVKRIVVDHFGGQIEVDSVIGQGTTFTLTLAADVQGGAM